MGGSWCSRGVCLPCMGEGCIAYSRLWRRDMRSIGEGGSEMTRLYAAGDKAVSAVEDGKVRQVLEGCGARCVAADPREPETLYVGTSDEGLFRSEDAGEGWERISGIEHPRVTSVAVSPVDGAVYAGTEPSTLFVSRDGGGSWRARGFEEPPFGAGVELSAAALDLARARDRALSRGPEPGRGRHRARGRDAQRGRWGELGGPEAGSLRRLP